MPGRLQFDFSPQPRGPARTDGSPMRLLVVGDFSARPGSEKRPLAERPTHRVDVDTLDAVMQKLAPRLAIGGGEAGFESLDDFHPDALFARLPVFASLRQMRRRLMDPAQFAQAAAELGAASPPPAAAPASAASDSADLLAGLLGGRPAALPATAPGAASAAGVDAFIRRVIAPHIQPDHRQQQAALVASVDAATAAEMRGVLHAPAFQLLEAAWRGVQWLITNLELDEALELYLFDVAQDELLADVVASQGRLADTGLYRALARRQRETPDGQRWTLLAGLQQFGDGDADVGLLAALGLIAQQAGGPYIATASAALSAAEAPTPDAWTALRRSEAAPWLGLAGPRVLLRLPYGRRSEPCSAFDFEEFPGGQPQAAGLLWGPAALAVALLIGRAYQQRGWAFEPGDERELADLPAHAYTLDGESLLQPCAEHALDEAAAQALLDRGLMPVQAHRHRNAVTLPRLQSLALPARALGGWGAG